MQARLVARTLNAAAEGSSHSRFSVDAPPIVRTGRYMSSSNREIRRVNQRASHMTQDLVIWRSGSGTLSPVCGLRCGKL
jgi:hypothetical protein